MIKKIFFFMVTIVTASCSEEDVPEQNVIFNGQIFVYDYENNNSLSEWNPLASHTVSLFANKSDNDHGCYIFGRLDQELKGSTTSNEEGFYEIIVPLSSSGISYDAGTLYWGCPNLRVETSDQIGRIFSESTGNEKYIESKDIYFGRKASLFINTSSGELDSAFVTITNSNELIGVGTFYFFKREYQIYGEILGKSVELSLAYDPNPTYQIEIQKYKDGQLSEESFDINLNLDLITRVVVNDD